MIEQGVPPHGLLPAARGLAGDAVRRRRAHRAHRPPALADLDRRDLRAHRPASSASRWRPRPTCRLALIPRERFVDLARENGVVHQRIMSKVSPVTTRLTTIQANRERLAVARHDGRRARARAQQPGRRGQARGQLARRGAQHHQLRAARVRRGGHRARGRGEAARAPEGGDRARRGARGARPRRRRRRRGRDARAARGHGDPRAVAARRAALLPRQGLARARAARSPAR